MPQSINLPPVPALAGLLLLALAMPAEARPGGWGGPGWGGREPGSFDGPSSRQDMAHRDHNREGHVGVSRFVAEGKSDQLGHGVIGVTSNSPGDDFTGPGERARFEAAVVDQLVHLGYDTTARDPKGGQIAELRVIRSTVEPEGPRHKPVSGEAAIEAGNRGTRYGMAIAIDLSKPLPPLLSTRLEARIRDKATGDILWEGRADVETREGDARWSEQEIAARLAEALFDHFPLAS